MNWSMFVLNQFLYIYLLIKVFLFECFVIFSYNSNFQFFEKYIRVGTVQAQSAIAWIQPFGKN